MEESNVREENLSEEDLEQATQNRMAPGLQQDPLANNQDMEKRGNMVNENQTLEEEANEQMQTEDEESNIPKAARENLQGSDRVFPGGPTHNQVENWKQEFGDIYMTEFDDETYIWRTLSRLEYKNLMNQGSSSEWEGEELIAQTCVLWPENYGPEEISDGKAGVPSILSDQIMAKSGFAAQSRAQKL